MQSANKKRIIRIAVLCISVFLLVFGLLDGGFKDVKNKAVMICYECMGIG